MSLKLNMALERLTGGHNERAKKEAEYPYMVFSARRLSEDDDIQKYTLEVNVWDKHVTSSRAEDMMDKLEERLHKCNEFTGNMLIRIFKGPRQQVDDPDPQIRRVRELFEMIVYETEEKE